MSQGTVFSKRWHVRPVKTQISPSRLIRVCAVHPKTIWLPRQYFVTTLIRLCEFAGWYASRKHTCTYIIFTPLNPTFIYKNWGLQGDTLFFLFLLKNIDCGYSLEPPRRGGSNDCPQSMFWAEIRKISNFVFWKLSVFGGGTFNIFE